MSWRRQWAGSQCLLADRTREWPGGRGRGKHAVREMQDGHSAPADLWVNATNCNADIKCDHKIHGEPLSCRAALKRTRDFEGRHILPKINCEPAKQLQRFWNIYPLCRAINTLATATSPSGLIVTT
jgi:hypothetical protein